LALHLLNNDSDENDYSPTERWTGEMKAQLRRRRPKAKQPSETGSRALLRGRNPNSRKTTVMIRMKRQQIF
jgi:hypothetical protein